MPRYRFAQQALRTSEDVFASFGRRALIIGGKTALSKALADIEAACVEAGVAVAGVEHYGGECTYTQMARLADIGRMKAADLILGVGGGKAIDTAKGCAHMMRVPVITAPTIAATCAAVTAISVVYDEHGIFVESMFHAQPPACAIIDMGIIADAPEKYLRAGIGDALAKHVECTLASRGRELTHTCTLAVTISQTSYDPLLRYGLQAMDDARAGRATEALEQVTLSSIVSTGLVSLLIEEIYNGAIAHALFYGLTRLKDFEHKCLHGDAVGYGVLVQQMLDGKRDSFETLCSFMKSLGMPVTLRDIGFALTQEVLEEIVPATLKVLANTRVMPYEVTPSMLTDALNAVENAHLERRAWNEAENAGADS